MLACNTAFLPGHVSYSLVMSSANWFLCICQAMGGTGCYRYIFTMSRCLVPTVAFLLRTNMNGFWRSLGQVITGANRLTDYICCHVANDLTNFTVRTACCICRAGESIIHMQRQRHHTTAHSLQLCSSLIIRLWFMGSIRFSDCSLCLGLSVTSNHSSRSYVLTFCG